MNNKKLLEKAFQRGHLLKLKNSFYKDWVQNFIVEDLKADVGTGDITSDSVLLEGKEVKAVIFSRSSGILAGTEEISLILKDNRIKHKLIMKDGSYLHPGDEIMTLSGNEKDILKVERSVLDIISRMSGIATLTDDLIIKIRNSVAIAPTRKTQLRYLDKKAVYVGGGLTHRLSLWESILIKDNHLSALKRQGIDNPIELSLERAWENRKKAVFIEIEVSSDTEAIIAAEKFKQLNSKEEKYPCLIMLDNMKPVMINKTINKLKSLRLLNHVMIEASGGINPDNIKEYAATGVNVISLGYLTTAARSLDIKLKIR